MSFFRLWDKKSEECVVLHCSWRSTAKDIHPPSTICLRAPKEGKVCGKQTKKGHSCRNRTKHLSGKCWRHRGAELESSELSCGHQGAKLESGGVLQS
jgi:hypothetical protein